ncbi:MAG: Lipid-A-disaccharide synthase [Lentisphaerae bacterium ADurb.Bin242]|nr:MAG: Lipid-A-disaccharide synthase [Lentisphaerae bacterium ADurb.Bin242]
MIPNPKVWLIAGEASGDLYGAQLAADLFKLNPRAELSGMGGVKMKEAGVHILVDSSELGVVGLIEVLGSIFKFIRIFYFLLRKAAENPPDAVVLIDYPGFNIRLAKRLKKMGIPVIWYISPQVWVWRKSNIPKLARYCTKMLVIFPFEVEVYKDSGLDVEFVGHPLVEIVQERRDPALARDPNRILLLPGSRRSETKRLLYPMLRTVSLLKERRPELEFVVASPRKKVADDVLRDLKEFRETHPEIALPEIPVVCGETARCLQTCAAGFAASGTVTVECAIAGLPLVVAYRLNPVTFLLARLIIRKLFRNAFTMPNIILNRVVFEEFLQHQIVPEVLAGAMERILPGGDRRDRVLADMDEMTRDISGGVKGAGMNAVSAVLSVVNKKGRDGGSV